MPRLVLIIITIALLLGFQFNSGIYAQAPYRTPQVSPPQPSTNPVEARPQSSAPPQSASYVNQLPSGVDSGNALATPPNATPSDGEPFELAETVAQVGDQYILKGELIGDANLILSKAFTALDTVPVEQREQAMQELMEYREVMMTKQLLPLAIERKLKYLEFLRSLPTETDPKKLEDRRNKIQSQAGKAFADNLDEMVTKLFQSKPDEYEDIARQSPQLFRLASVMKDTNIRSREDPALERVLKDHQTSLAKQQQAFIEYLLGQTAIRQKINLQPEVTHAQMVSYYREHLADYEVPTQAQWEQLTVYFQRFPTEEAAWDAICKMGNAVYLGGAPLWSVAKHNSQEKNAANGGFHDWTTLGDLKISKQINDAVFSLPPNELSDIIRDEKGLHIVRVLDRKLAYTKSFTEVQASIKEKLRNESLNKEYAAYVVKLRQRTPVVIAEEFSSPAGQLATPPRQNQGVSR